MRGIIRSIHQSNIRVQAYLDLFANCDARAADVVDAYHVIMRRRQFIDAYDVERGNIPRTHDFVPVHEYSTAVEVIDQYDLSDETKEHVIAILNARFLDVSRPFNVYSATHNICAATTRI